jgi:protein-L-isoaspartate(D-aspartate) O-methyltransferase
MAVPVGQRYQQILYLLKKSGGKMERESLLPMVFVPMTGEAEKRRKVQPDPSRPAVENGDFEEVAGDPPRPTGWYYQRQLEMNVAATDAPSGKNYVTFHNAEAGRLAEAFQFFGLDGRKVKALDLSVRVRGRNIRPGQSHQQLPVVGLIFYDENRMAIDEKVLGPWSGTFGWQQEKQRIDVPGRAREALVRIGLFGALGEMSVDDVKLTVVK